MGSSLIYTPKSEWNSIIKFYFLGYKWYLLRNKIIDKQID